MKILRNTIVMTGIFASILALSAFVYKTGYNKNNTERITEGKSFAVLELFTSEGCNSCPPAEELMAKLAKESNGKPVYILNYHVDYFDYLGWKDVFGSPDNTRRQKQYSQWLNAQVYTPQLVVNGKNEFIGSDEKAIRDEIVSELSIKHAASLVFQARRNIDRITINYNARNIQPEDRLILAYIQKAGATNVLRGENAGLKFHHVQIVKKLASFPLKNSEINSAEILVPKNQDKDFTEIVGMVQNNKTGLITAVNSAPIN